MVGGSWVSIKDRMIRAMSLSVYLNPVLLRCSAAARSTVSEMSVARARELYVVSVGPPS